MEPMALGSPSGSPAANTSYLPSFLMGEQAQTTPRNTLSPNKMGRNLSLASSPISHSPQDNNRSVLGQKTLFEALASPTHHVICSGNDYYAGSPIQNHNASISGPPTQGLFDSLRQEKILLPSLTINRDKTATVGVASPYEICSNYGGYAGHQAQAYNDSYLGSGSFNACSIMSPKGPSTPNIPLSLVSSGPAETPIRDYWITVYGFPPSSATIILQHFAKCGTIQDKVFPPQNGNWVHIKYSSRLECDKALNFNEKIIGNIMIGVKQCREKRILDKENLSDNRTLFQSKVRPLTQSPFLNAQNDTSVIASPNTPQRSTGLVNKAMDLLFGW